MLVYADRSEIAQPDERLADIHETLAKVVAMRGGVNRHAKLVRALIDAGQLLQGVADAGRTGEDALNLFVHALAACVLRSWDSGFAETGELPWVPAIGALPVVELRFPEGFAFYAVYPEAYIQAARQLSLSGPPRVIGIRSIGTTLGAVVAAALGAPAATTARPFGDPFARQVDLPDELLEDDAHYVIVDEGPGLSGSSFGAVADWLEQHGVPVERIAVLPSHSGAPGPQASDVHRRRWNSAQRVAADFGGRLPELVRGWGKTLIAPGDQLSFAGLGRIGERKLEMTRTLHAAGFTAEPVGLVHGFLVERPCEGAKPLEPDEAPIVEVARYIAARANLFPAEERGGASVEELLEMCRRNISLALGDGAARSLDRWRVERLPPVTRVRTDNRMDRRNWLRTADGRLIKTDALDHCQGHDLVGCQDAAWDVAGAVFEFGMDEREGEALFHAVEQGGRTIRRDLLAFCLLAYLSFRLGESTLAGSADAERYAMALRELLHQHVCGATPQESSVG